MTETWNPGDSRVSMGARLSAQLSQNPLDNFLLTSGGFEYGGYQGELGSVAFLPSARFRLSAFLQQGACSPEGDTSATGGSRIGVDG